MYKPWRGSKKVENHRSEYQVLVRPDGLSVAFAEVCITCNGEDYRGQVDHTVTNRECQRWDQQQPHQHIYQPEKCVSSSFDLRASL